MVKITELGCAGHLFVTCSCAWRRHTQVGTCYRVSTVGDYFPSEDKGRGPLGIAPDSFFQTIVFATIDEPKEHSEGCGCMAVVNWDTLECVYYTTAGAAQAGHEEMVKKYRRIANREVK